MTSSFVRLFVVVLFSLEHSNHLKQDLLRELEGCQGCLFEVSRMFQGNFKGVYSKYHGCFKEFRRVFQGRIKSCSRKFQGTLKGV